MRDRLLDHDDIIRVEFLPCLTLQNCFQIRKFHFPLRVDRAGRHERLYNGFLVFVAGLFLSANEWKILFYEDKPWQASCVVPFQKLYELIKIDFLHHICHLHNIHLLRKATQSPHGSTEFLCWNRTVSILDESFQIFDNIFTTSLTLSNKSNISLDCSMSTRLSSSDLLRAFSVRGLMLRTCFKSIVRMLPACWVSALWSPLACWWSPHYK